MLHITLVYVMQMCLYEENQWLRMKVMVHMMRRARNCSIIYEFVSSG